MPWNVYWNPTVNGNRHPREEILVTPLATGNMSVIHSNSATMTSSEFMHSPQQVNLLQCSLAICDRGGPFLKANLEVAIKKMKQQVHNKISKIFVTWTSVDNGLHVTVHLTLWCQNYYYTMPVTREKWPCLGRMLGIECNNCADAGKSTST